MQTLPLVVTSPHSGRNYSPEFVASTRLSPRELRQSEDCFVDELFSSASPLGAPLLSACFPRCFCDVNREAWELDPEMFADRLPAWVNTRSVRVQSGLGTIARVVATNEPMYDRKLTFAEARQRIATCWVPFHVELHRLAKLTQAAFGVCLIVDCHSMPALPRASCVPDFIIGDAYGTSCAPNIPAALEAHLRELGFRVARNTPYAGGFITTHYGQPCRQSHAIQLEVARGLYMDEKAFQPSPSFLKLQSGLSSVITRLAIAVPGFR